MEWVRSRRALFALVVLLHTAVLLAGPVVHHDFACHLENPTHCDACLANPPGTASPPQIAPAAAVVVAVVLVAAPPAQPLAGLQGTPQGRAPPSC